MKGRCATRHHLCILLLIRMSLTRGPHSYVHMIIFLPIAAYLANYPFNKESTKEHHEQVVKNVLLPK